MQTCTGPRDADGRDDNNRAKVAAVATTPYLSALSIVPVGKYGTKIFTDFGKCRGSAPMIEYCSKITCGRDIEA